MYTLGDYQDKLLAGPMTATYVWSEVKELGEAVRSGNLTHVVEEWNDVCLCLLLLVALGWFGWRWFPILQGFGLSAKEKFEARHAVWEEIFSHHGAGPYYVHYGRGGTNYRKTSKVEASLALAGFEGDVDWPWVSTLVGGMEG